LILNRLKRLRVRVAGIIIEDGKILLIAHKKKKDVYWLLPGGGVDFGESLEEALKRELMEELGVSVEVEDIFCVIDSIAPEDRRHIVNVCFKCCCAKGDISLGNDKRLHDFGFFSSGELDSMVLYPSMAEQLKGLLADGGHEKIYLGKKWMNL